MRKEIIAFCQGIAAGLLLSQITCRRDHYRATDSDHPSWKVDTVVRTDTVWITRYAPVYVSEHVTDTVIRYLPVYGSDSGDSATVVVERSQRVYEDSLYTAWVSGYEPKLDSISLALPRRERIVTMSGDLRRKRWSVGLSAGIGYSSNGVSPYIGVGISYSLLNF